MAVSETQHAVGRVWRAESARVMAGLARAAGDIGAAQELAEEALAAALERWPREGVPDDPGAWLLAAGRRRAGEPLRRRGFLDGEIAGQPGRRPAGQGRCDGAAEEFPPGGDVQDDVLRLVFTVCHPLLPAKARAALALRLLGGLTTGEIARALLVAEATAAERVTGAIGALSQARVPFEAPAGAELAGRLPPVLEAVHLIFTEGYTAAAGDGGARGALCEEALRLGGVLAGLLPGQAEVHGLLALMEIQASRSAARTGPCGEPVLLLEQDRAKWDRAAIARGLAALARAEQAAAPGPYTLRAAIAACHARAGTAARTDWRRIAALYEALVRQSPSPVAELNRAVALTMAFGPQAGLRLVDGLAGDPRMDGHPLLPCVRGDLLVRLGRTAEAGREFRRAASLTRDERERSVLLARAAVCEAPAVPALSEDTAAQERRISARQTSGR
ncbi:RNA polymerase sigma factor [Sphaerisporangium melleum]|uniref:RNA polymerase sigma factor n=1 Tax=Sphaerisporangium melleum TaxID=321316 RepID=A0A917RCS5_9ACTN|nr:DUF6596 domain-containing protein [Sphaerisporangium melleum]GGL01986.1 RNA polymerase sigma factor [Sphaerisporangium melleum]GII72195.1 RNA polymerase sigma factor [Sphaerisporangium melleum]